MATDCRLRRGYCSGTLRDGNGGEYAASHRFFAFRSYKRLSKSLDFAFPLDIGHLPNGENTRSLGAWCDRIAVLRLLFNP